MKNLPLALQIWLVIAGIILFVFVLIAAFLPWTLRSFFTQQVYDILQDSQNSVRFVSIAAAPAASPDVIILPEGGMAGEYPSGIRIGVAGQPVQEPPVAVHKIFAPLDFVSLKPLAFEEAMPVVRHIVISDGIQPHYSSLPDPFLKAVEEDARGQEEDIQKYSREIEGDTLFYVIRKEQVQGKPGYMVSFSWGNYRNDLVMSMFWRLMLLMIFLFFIIWPPSLWLARYLTRPLVRMEGHITRIADRDWHDPFVLDRRDEIGRLARTFENMRQRLVRQDRAQQSFLQHVSHELKTPVMVIRSYAQSILDGIFPKGTLNGSIDVINSEAERLEKRIHDLLYLTKLNYLASRERAPETFNLAEVVNGRVERFRCRRPDLSWDVDVTPACINGDREQWAVVVENLLDNQTRYAGRHIAVSLSGCEKGDGRVVLRVWNDGPHIEEGLMDSLFERYRSGMDGEFGLGLAIVKQIADVHRANVRVENEAEGVAFIIEIPGHEGVS